MTQTDSSLPKRKGGFVFHGSRNEVIASWLVIIVLVLIAQYIFFTLILPLTASDGVNNFSGIKKEAAQRAVDAKYSLIDNKARWAYKISATAVHPATMQECSSETRTQLGINGPNNTGYYTVTLDVKSLFSYGSSTEALPLCSKFY